MGNRKFKKSNKKYCKKNRGSAKKENDSKAEDTSFAATDEEVLTFHETVRRFFLTSTTLKQHLEAQEENATRYAATLAVLEESGVVLSESSRPRALAAAFIRSDKDLVKFMMTLPEEKLSVKEVVKAITLLDARRTAKATEKKLKRLQDRGCKKKGKMAMLKSLIASLEAEAAPRGGVGRFVRREVKKWVKRIPAERFVFYASHFPKEPWKKLADICHLHPEKDFSQSPWFLPFCYGKAAPEDSVVQKSSGVNAENVASLVMEADIDYSVVRQHTTSLPTEGKVRVANYTTKLDTIIWYYEELGCPEVDAIILKRLQDGEKLKMPYGKLMERLLMFQQKKQRDQHDLEFVGLMLQQAQERLAKINIQLEKPVAVIGDRSGSMEVAIRTSNIIGSLLAVACNARLTFFDSGVMYPPFIPETAAQVVELSDIVKTGGSTSPAAALWPYYKDKTIIKTFIIATDEEENTMHEDYNFVPLFVKYHEEVYPATLVFVSFLYSQNVEGQMVRQFKGLKNDIKVLQFRFDRHRPDLTKLDNVLALLSHNKESFTDDVERMEARLLEHKTTDCLNISGSNCQLL